MHNTFLPPNWTPGMAYDLSPHIATIDGHHWSYVSAIHDHNAPTCVMVHGVPGSHRDFRYLIPACLEKGLNVVAVDMPGFGDTPLFTTHHSDTQTPFERAQQFIPLLQSLQLNDMIFVGHSIGGSVALQLAALFGTYTRGLTLINSVGLSRHRGLRRIPKWPMKHLTALAFQVSPTTWLEQQIAAFYCRTERQL